MTVIPNSCRECNQHDCVNHQFEWFTKNNPNVNSANSVSPACPLLKEVSQEPTTKHNLGVDCISRKQAIECLELNYSISAGADNSKERYRYMQALADTQAIRELPPATLQEPRKGHWTCDRANVRCSCCGKGYKDFYGKARIASYNYCPNCGAKMESEDHK